MPRHGQASPPILATVIQRRSGQMAISGHWDYPASSSTHQSPKTLWGRWLAESGEAGDGPDCAQHEGWVRWAFIHSFRRAPDHLLDPGPNSHSVQICISGTYLSPSLLFIRRVVWRGRRHCLCSAEAHVCATCLVHNACCRPFSPDPARLVRHH